MEFEDFITVILILIVIIFIICVISKGLDEKEEEAKQLDCYKTYAVDGVILKKCQEYFEEVKE